MRVCREDGPLAAEPLCRRAHKDAEAVLYDEHALARLHVGVAKQLGERVTPEPENLLRVLGHVHVDDAQYGRTLRAVGGVYCRIRCERGVGGSRWVREPAV
jgi:hypothetical protein